MMVSRRSTEMPANDGLKGTSATKTNHDDDGSWRSENRVEKQAGNGKQPQSRHRAKNASLASYIEERRLNPEKQWFDKTFIRRQLLPKLPYHSVDIVESVLKHRYEVCVSLSDETKEDFKIRGDRVTWKTGIRSNDGASYAVLSMPADDGPGHFSVEWRIGRPRKIVRINSAPIPIAYHDHVMVNSHTLERSAQRSGAFVCLDGVHRLITSAIEQGSALTRVYYRPPDCKEGSIQWLLPGQNPMSIFVIRLDKKSGHIFTATALKPGQAEVLRQTANPLTHRGIAQNRKGVEA